MPPYRPEPDPRVRLIDETRLHAGRVFELWNQRIELPGGIRQDLDLLQHPGAVAVAARDAEGRLMVVRQYRGALGQWTEELPAGRLEVGEDPLEAARRELEEETGYRAREWTLIRSFPVAPGFAGEIIHLFHAKGLEAVPGGGLAPDADEDLAVHWRTPKEILGSLNSDAKTLLALWLTN